jgi:hypothetical protein
MNDTYIDTSTSGYPDAMMSREEIQAQLEKLKRLSHGLSLMISELNGLSLVLQQAGSTPVEGETFDAPRLIRLEMALEEALKNGHDSFEFDEMFFFIGYARHVIEYLRQRLV